MKKELKPIATPPKKDLIEKKKDSQKPSTNTSGLPSSLKINQNKVSKPLNNGRQVQMDSTTIHQLQEIKRKGYIIIKVGKR